MRRVLDFHTAVDDNNDDVRMFTLNMQGPSKKANKLSRRSEASRRRRAFRRVAAFRRAVSSSPPSM